MISFLNRLLELWKNGGKVGPNPTEEKLKELNSGQLRRVDIEAKKAAKWHTWDLSKLNIHQLQKLARRAVRWDSHDIADRAIREAARRVLHPRQSFLKTRRGSAT